MPLAPIESVGLVAVGASAAASALGAQSAKFAGLMRSKLRSMQPATASPAQSAGPQFHLPGGASLDASTAGRIRTSLHSDLKQIQSRLAADAAQNGIDVGAGVTLQVDSNGITHVVASSQQQAALESLIAGDSQLDTLISSAAQKARVLHAAENVNGSGPSAQQSFEAGLSAVSGPLASVTLFVSSQRVAVNVNPST